jgi:hypothetical protein
MCYLPKIRTLDQSVLQHIQHLYKYCLVVFKIHLAQGHAEIQIQLSKSSDVGSEIQASDGSPYHYHTYIISCMRTATV